MPNQLTSETLEHIATLCGHIAAGRGLSTEVRRELQTHIEDKVLGYLNMEVAVSEADALILARAHFGDPETLRGLLHAAHDIATNDSLSRHLLTLLILTFGMHMAMSTGIKYIGPVYAWLHLSIPVQIFVQRFFNVFLLAGLLYFMKRQMDNGKNPWFVRWNLLRLSAGCVILIALHWTVSYVACCQDLVRLNTLPPPPRPSVDPFAVYWILGGYYAGILGLSLLWMWWCDQPARPWQQHELTAFLFFVTYGFLMPGANIVFRGLYGHELMAAQHLAYPDQSFFFNADAYRREIAMQLMPILILATLGFSIYLLTRYTVHTFRTWRHVREAGLAVAKR